MNTQDWLDKEDDKRCGSCLLYAGKGHRKPGCIMSGTYVSPDQPACDNYE